VKPAVIDRATEREQREKAATIRSEIRHSRSSGAWKGWDVAGSAARDEPVRRENSGWGIGGQRRVTPVSSFPRVFGGNPAGPPAFGLF